ncbi:hypothetical protein CGCF415_v001218 [Colletotrichum fructicola]|uniref:Secreted protein n=3 Tax=Colletotrichum gloeosporioides species complex TaxID=2707338 RepID=L2FGQ2_COLFN|nr:uncharacterized protein CGMCC3_g6933 [Colletotrichum fructicola]XP_053033913.1 uncharacterized protein COL26b_009391 [Colletotrichum chrysophilum]KAF4485524.1 hypothetical protein CGGC5_v007580 [Colletotrichum fructicola Nara gc5]KAH9238941.1 hypothetical protein K456DRAFT_49127 [Colletotrichum gloeosporioides 23]KAJ0286465.1 hypothetical protein CBS470a_005851 [Colletotrichum nupharicola]KAJ0289094.1 hypothetical protein COL940_001695 [Colletotrichum noveboracense]KAE9577055.1 hypothetica
MKLLLLHPIILLLLAALTPLTTASSAKCSRWKDGIPITKNFVIPMYRRYSIEVSGMDEGEDVPALCGTLWKELKQFKGSCVVSVDKPTCEANGPTALQWSFSVGLGCNKGMVHAAWWDSTKNRLGKIEC